jgi:nicotinate-nucleotide adenylyltransferase
VRRLVVLYGGTFDPVHLGHLDAAEDVRARTGCEELRLVPCHRPPHRAAPGVDAAVRRHLLELAVADREGLVVDPIELDHDEPSYTVRTLERVRERLGPEPALGWVLGTDAAAALDRWHRWRELPDLAHLLLLDRPGATLPETGPVAALLAPRRTEDPAALRAAPAGAVLDVHQRPRAIAATDVRAALADGRDVTGLLPPRVWSYIRDEGLYGVRAR